MRTKTNSGPSRVRSGLLFARAFWKEGGMTPFGSRAPVPIEVWSPSELGKPMAGMVAVPTTWSTVGGT